ncbi:MAG: hypothetical protein HQ556_16020 [Candidatus Marinimicrobia bacterium]|nr:hypothetical protein [Candidatus Neomarinimicrobiota bacterium]
MFKIHHIFRLFLLLMASIANLSASGYTSKNIYVSPGVSIGYTFGEGFNYGAQVSIGLIGLIYQDEGYFSSGDAWLPSNEIYPAYSLGFGFRISQLNNFKYIDLQVWDGDGVGAGVGLAKVTDEFTGDSELYNHLKLYVGYIPLVQLDVYYQIREMSAITSLGVTGVLPFPVVAISKDIDEEP